MTDFKRLPQTERDPRMTKWVLDTIEGRTEFDKFEDAKTALIDQIEVAMDDATDNLAELDKAMAEVEQVSEPRSFSFTIGSFNCLLEKR
jgi:hypothetical protein